MQVDETSAAKGFPDGETAASRPRRLAALRASGAFATLAALAFIAAFAGCTIGDTKLASESRQTWAKIKIQTGDMYILLVDTPFAKANAFAGAYYYTGNYALQGNSLLFRRV